MPGRELAKVGFGKFDKLKGEHLDLVGDGANGANHQRACAAASEQPLVARSPGAEIDEEQKVADSR